MEDAFKIEDSNFQHEYLRITMGYYQSHYASTAMGSTASQVYGKYIHYKKWLENRMRESLISKTAIGLPALEPGPFNDHSLIGRDIFEKIFKRSRLSDFFRVPAPRQKGRFWYDINDKDTDIPEKVVRISEISISQTRRATEADFPAIHDRISTISDEKAAAYRYFINDVISHVNQMKKHHQDLHKSHERSLDHYELLELADRFMLWLNWKNNSLPLIAYQAIPQISRSNQPESNLPTQNLIALICLYKGIIVTRKNGDEIARAYGHQSGIKIYNRYIHYSTRSNLVGDELTSVKNKNKLKLFEDLINHLQDQPDALTRAKQDIAEFKQGAALD